MRRVNQADASVFGINFTFFADIWKIWMRALPRHVE
jgi:hypothetical protein